MKVAARDGKLLQQPQVVDSPLAGRGLTVSYGEKPAIFSIDAVAPAESMAAIGGPKGAGQSTGLWAVLGCVEP